MADHNLLWMGMTRLLNHWFLPYFPLLYIYIQLLLYHMEVYLNPHLIWHRATFAAAGGTFGPPPLPASPYLVSQRTSATGFQLYHYEWMPANRPLISARCLGLSLSLSRSRAARLERERLLLRRDFTGDFRALGSRPDFWDELLSKIFGNPVTYKPCLPEGRCLLQLIF